jgi:tripartite-type tricarboxylate transporter receptor subunit TctC
LAAVAAVLAACGLAHAQTFPDRPVKIILGFAPGGGSDVPTRIVAPKLTKVLGQPVVVENRSGAGGYVGAQLVARSAPDGYTLYGCTIATHGIGPGLYKTAPVDAEKDFSFVGMIGSNPNVLMVHPSVPAKTLAEFIAWAKVGGDKITYAAPSLGGSPHLSMELLKQMAGLEMVGVVYRGDAPARQDVMAGQLPATFAAIGPSLSAIKGGLVRAIAVSSPKRHPALPDVPTVEESGFPGFRVISWLGLCGPAGTPEPVLDILNAALVKVLNEPETREQLARASVEPEPLSRADFTSFVKSEIAKWRKVTKDAGIAMELTK